MGPDGLYTVDKLHRQLFVHILVCYEVYSPDQSGLLLKVRKSIERCLLVFP